MSKHQQAEECRDPEMEHAAQGEENAVAAEPQPAEGVEPQADSSQLKIKELEETNEKCKAEISELKDQYLRKAAEFENFRKRMTRDKEESIAYANVGLLSDIIPVLDDFERALKAASEGDQEDPLYQGIAMIEKRFVAQLESKWGLVRLNTVGAEFDPNQHEAVSVEQTAEVNTPTVAEEYIKGYSLNGRVVRSAKVRVRMPAAGAPDGEAPKA